MRTGVLLLSAALFAGCLQASPPQIPGSTPVRSTSFDAVDAPWVAQMSSGCGMCSGAGGFRDHTEHHNLFVFEDARIVLVEYNGGPWGENVTHVAPDVTFGHSQLDALVRASPRGDEGERWVVRVYTGGATDPQLPDRLRAQWGGPVQDSMCTDAGIAYLLRHANGTVETQTYTCGPIEEPMQTFAQEMADLLSAMREHGARQGTPAP